MTINWDEAPEGATHYNSVTRYIHPWLKECPLSFWESDRWQTYANHSVGQQHIAAAVPKPPPYKDIGSILEYRDADGDCWRKGEVIAHAKGKVVVMDLEDDVVGLYAMNEIRPILTVEEVAQKRKEEEISEIRNTLAKALAEGEDPAEAVYQAGFRLTRLAMYAW